MIAVIFISILYIQHMGKDKSRKKSQTVEME